MKKQIIAYTAVALAAVLAGCSDDVTTEYIEKPLTMTAGEVVENELGALLPEAGENLYVNGYRCPILSNGESSFHNIPGALQYVVHTQESVVVDGTKVGFNIPSSQTYREGGLSKAACPLYSLTDNEGLEHIVFKPAVGALKIVIPASNEEAFKQITSVELSCKSYVLTGDLQVDAATDETYILGNATQKLTVKGTINILNGAEVYCAMPPMRFLEDLTVKLVHEKITLTLPVKVKGQSIERGKVLAAEVTPQWKVLTPYYGSANAIVVAPGTTEVEFDCAPHTSESLTYAYTRDGSGNLLPPADAAAQPLATSADVLWNDVATDFITNLQLTNNKSKLKAKLSGAPGNALVAIRDAKGNVLWSFHIWVTETADHDYGNGYIFMDRNLGAVSINPNDEFYSTRSLLYQWGRKDPFPTGASADATKRVTLYNDRGTTDIEGHKKTSSSVGTIAYATAHPTLQIDYSSKSPGRWIAVANDALWGNPAGFDNPAASTIRKSVYDPCPEGYMVAPNDAWVLADKTTSVFPTTGTSISKNGLQVTINGNETFYPYSGLYNGGGSLSSVGKDGSVLKSNPLKAAGQAAYMICTGNKPTVIGKGNRPANCYTVRCVKETK